MEKIKKSRGIMSSIDEYSLEFLYKHCDSSNKLDKNIPHSITYIDDMNNVKNNLGYDLGCCTNYKDIDGNLIHTKHILLSLYGNKESPSICHADGIINIDLMEDDENGGYSFGVSNNHCSHCPLDGMYKIIGIELPNDYFLFIDLE